MASKMPRAALPPLVFVRSVLRSFMAKSGLEPTLFGAKRIRVTHAAHGRVDFELDITKDHTNRLGTLHGGTIASMVDLGGSLAVAATGLYATGVSTDLNVTYLNSGGQAGNKITATAVCEKIGKTLAFTSVTFRNHEGKLAARGSHTKHVAQAVSSQDELLVLPSGAQIEPEDWEGTGMTSTDLPPQLDEPENNENKKS